ncbi:MAG TPA: NUDIX domain-containing protein [Patescibacteria group bacterium]
MDKFRNAAKAFIVKDGKLLLLKRRANDAYMPGTWDNPGGRLEQGENPYTGLQREVKEETDLDIEVWMPLDVHYFTRDDGQQITLIIFVCKLKSEEIRLSEEIRNFNGKIFRIQSTNFLINSNAVSEDTIN